MWIKNNLEPCQMKNTRISVSKLNISTIEQKDAVASTEELRVWEVVDSKWNVISKFKQVFIIKLVEMSDASLFETQMSVR